MAADLFNTADYGLPQQRRRAWVLCVQTSQLDDPKVLTSDMTQFKRLNVPLENILDPRGPLCSSKCGKGHGNSGAKWKDGFKEQCEIFGKDRNVDQTCQRSKFKKPSSFTCII